MTGEKDVTALLTEIGAHGTTAVWRAQRRRRTARPPRHPATAGPSAFSAENQRRAAASAAAAAARTHRALEILGTQTPPHLAAAARLRLEHPHAPLEQLGRLAVPPLSKDTIAGRLRRLLRTADARAAALHIPDTTTAIPPP